MMGDAHDSLILCNASELMARRRRLAPLSAVVVGGEPIFWPGRARYGGVALAKQYPNALGGSPLKYVNAGTQVGSPAALLGLIRCMRAARQHGQAVREWSTSWRAPISVHGSRSHEPAPEGLQGAPHSESGLRGHTAQTDQIWQRKMAMRKTS